DGIRGLIVTGVQTCALPILNSLIYLQTTIRYSEPLSIGRQRRSRLRGPSHEAHEEVADVGAGPAHAYERAKRLVQGHRIVPGEQIGRASCRERVEISVGEGA